MTSIPHNMKETINVDVDEKHVKWQKRSENSTQLNDIKEKDADGANTNKRCTQQNKKIENTDPETKQRGKWVVIITTVIGISLVAVMANVMSVDRKQGRMSLDCKRNHE